MSAPDRPLSTTIVPAAPGWSVLAPWSDATGLPEGFVVKAIVAWRVEVWPFRGAETMTCTSPVTLGNNSDTGENHPVEDPYGRVEIIEDCWFSDRDAALVYLRGKALYSGAGHRGSALVGGS
jgi:hypothetical protein